MRPRLLVFDLDGTLIDSEQDLANSVNAMLDSMGRRPLPLALIRSYIGDGASMLVRRALGHPEGHAHEEAELRSALAFFLDFYRQHKLDHTRVYAGVLEALTAIRVQMPEVAMAVLTNKPVRPSREICAALGLAPFFFQIYGGDSFPHKKPHPGGLRNLMVEAAEQPALKGEVAIAPEATVMIGDSPVDVATAAAVGARSIGCRFGLAAGALIESKPTLLAESPSEWPELLNQLR